MHRIISRLTYANVISSLCLFLLLSGGTAAALNGANTVFSDDIVDNQVYSADVRNDNLSGGGLAAADLRPNSAGSSEVTNGSIQNADLAPAARGARAYGRVGGEGNDITRDKNVTFFGHINDLGIYCIGLASSIDPAGAVLIASPDFFGDSTSPNTERASIAEWDSAAPDCDPGQLEVRTFVHRGDSFDNNDGTGSGPGDDVVPADETFSFIVP